MLLRVIAFSSYYVQLRVAVLLGRKQTRNPLGLRWRWRHWSRELDR
jgi:hypothetical protein